MNTTGCVLCAHGWCTDFCWYGIRDCISVLCFRLVRQNQTSPHLATHQDSNQDTQMSCHHCFVDQDHVGAVALFDLLSLAFDIMNEQLSH